MTEEKKLGPVRFVPGENGGRYPHSHSVYVEDAGVLIDCGADRRRLQELRDGPGVREVWLTHWHEDHFTSLDLFADVPLRHMGNEAAPLADLETFLDWYGIANADYRAHWRQHLRDDFHFRPRHAHTHLQPDEQIDLGSCTVDVLHTPGHTPGHLAFFFREQQIVFMGDYDLTRFGPWYGDRDSDLDELIASVQRLRALDARVWLASHGDGCFENDPRDLFDAYLAVIDARHEKLLDYLAEPRTLDEIAVQYIVYRKPREPAAIYDWGERAILGKHLQRMLAHHEIATADGRYWRVA